MTATIIDLPSSRLAWIGAAAKVALTSSCDIRHGAILVSGGRIVGRGVNKRRHDWRFMDSSCTTHAEADALRIPLKRGTVRGIMYSVRLSSAGNLALARPCEACWDLLATAGVRKVVWSTDDGIEEAYCG